MYNINQTAQKLGVSAITIRRMIHDGRINAIKVGKGWRISRVEVNKILKNGIR